MNENAEQDVRLRILNTLLTTPHRDLAAVYPEHQRMITDDPRFYSQLAAWYNDTGEIRDHKEMFIISLCLSKFDGHREVGLAMLRELPPYQLTRVLKFVLGNYITERKPKVAATAPARMVRGRRVPAAPAQPAAPAKKIKTGLFRQLPNSVMTEINRYLQERELDKDWFDSVCVGARKYMKTLYAFGHRKPTDRAQAVLFDDKPPADSKAFLIKELAKATSPTDQARVIVENKIPYRIASTVIESMTPPVIAALLEVMTSQELVNSIGSLKKRGVFDNPDLKQLIEEKLVAAKSDKRVAALKSLEAVKATTGISEDVKKELEAVADQQIKSKGRISRPTALFVDKSGSQTATIELGKRIGSLLSTVMEDGVPLYAYAQDTIAYPITSQGKDLAAWEKAFEGIRASGWTSCGVGLQFMLSKGYKVEQIILVTDEGENTAPKFFDIYQKYCQALNAFPNICIVKTPNATDQLEREGRTKGVEVDAWQFTGDYYSLPGLVKFLCKPSKLDLLMEIMSWPLPKRKVA